MLDQAKNMTFILRKAIWISISCVLVLLRNVSSSSSSPSPMCSSDMDCSLNGRCINRAAGSAEYSKKDKLFHTGEKIPNAAPLLSTAGCLCDKSWSGEHCEKLLFLPTRGNDQWSDSAAPATAATTIASQGYGMTPNVTTWGGGILVEPWNSTTTYYHLFVSRMTNDCPLEYWTANSRVDHAVSTSIMGPYEFLDVAIPTFAHNPAPIELPPTSQWKYAIFHLGDGTSGTDGGHDCRNDGTISSDGIAKDARILGGSESSRHYQTQRWYLRTKTSTIHVSNNLYAWAELTDHNLEHCNNPAPWVHPGNGTLFVLCNHGGKSRLFKSQHGDISGPYELITEEFIPKVPHSHRSRAEDPVPTKLEDPTLYKDANGNFHIIYHAYQYDGSPDECQDSVVSAHAYSRDGYEWHLSPGHPYGSQIEVSFPGGSAKSTTTVTLATRERPKVVVSEGVITHVIEGVCGAPGCPTTGHHANFCVDCKYLNWDFTLVSTLDTS